MSPKQKNILAIFFLIGIFSPIMLYVYMFGFHLSSSHQRWAEFGSAISGIYSPLIAFIALLVLIGQAKAQVAMNKHNYDQTYIQEGRKDIDYFIDKLDSYLGKSYDQQLTVKEYLERDFGQLSLAELLSPNIQELAINFNIKHPKVFDVWLAIYPIIKGIGTPKEFPYEHNFTSTLLRISSTISLGTCIAIDNLYLSASEDIQKGNYYFTNVFKQ